MPVGDQPEKERERDNRAAKERRAASEELPFGPVDVRPVRHDENWIPVEYGQVPVEQPLDFAGIRRPNEERQGHRPIVDLPSDDPSARFPQAERKAAEPPNPPRSQRPWLGARPLAMAPADTDVLRGYGFGSAASAGDGSTGHLTGAVVAEISLLGAAAGVRKRQSQRRALSFTDFLTTVVANENGLTGQGEASFLPEDCG
jgi:hypothetical protein